MPEILSFAFGILQLVRPLSGVVETASIPTLTSAVPAPTVQAATSTTPSTPATPSASPSAASTSAGGCSCSDVPPSPNYTCAQQVCLVPSKQWYSALPQFLKNCSQRRILDNLLFCFSLVVFWHSIPATVLINVYVRHYWLPFLGQSSWIGCSKRMGVLQACILNSSIQCQGWR